MPVEFQRRFTNVRALMTRGQTEIPYLMEVAPNGGKPDFRRVTETHKNLLASLCNFDCCIISYDTHGSGHAWQISFISRGTNSELSAKGFTGLFQRRTQRFSQEARNHGWKDIRVSANLLSEGRFRFGSNDGLPSKDSIISARYFSRFRIYRSFRYYQAVLCRPGR